MPAPNFGDFAAQVQNDRRALAVAALQLEHKKGQDNMKVNTVDEIRDVPAGEPLFVNWMQTKKKVEWVSAGGGVFTRDGEEASADEFASAIHNGNVSRPSLPPKVGEWYSDGAKYLQCLSVEGDVVVLGSCGTQGFAKDLLLTRFSVDECDGLVSVPLSSVSSRVRQAVPMFLRMLRLERAQDRLDRVLESGVIPPEVEYAVRVEWTGLRGKVGEVTLTRKSRWGCACDSEDINITTVADTVGRTIVAGFRVLGCAPCENKEGAA